MHDCEECGKEITGEPEVCTDPWGGNPSYFCDEDCRDNNSEAAYERHLENFYGGDSPQTDHERQIAAYEAKRGF